VDTYNTLLTRGYATAVTSGVCGMSGVSAKQHAFFAGGSIPSYDGVDLTANVNIYNATLTKTSKRLTVGRMEMGSAAVGDYAIFAGGNESGSDDYSVEASTYVDAFDTSLTGKIATSLTEAHSGGYAGGSVGDYALFPLRSSTVDVYNTSLTKSKVNVGTTPSEQFGTSGKLGNYVLFAGGAGNKRVVAIDASLTAKVATSLSSGRMYLASATVGDYLLFGGGGGYSSAVDVYQI
jgi:hypothetical protein